MFCRVYWMFCGVIVSAEGVFSDLELPKKGWDGGVYVLYFWFPVEVCLSLQVA